jgi:hypothetical protein
MAAKTNYLENKLVDWLFRGVSFTPPAGLYIGLFTAAPSDTGGGTEVTGGSYARQALAPSTTNWAATNAAASTTNPSSGTSGTTSNNVAIAFPTATADWGTVTHFGIFDASTAGNLLIYGALTASQSLPNGGAYSFAAGALSIQEDN